MRAIKAPLVSGGTELFNCSIASEACRLIVDVGYSAMSMRCLAKKVGMQPGSLYHHYASKVDVLEAVLDCSLSCRLSSWLKIKSTVGSLRSKVKALVDFHLAYHRAQGRELTVLLTEIRYLDDERRDEILKINSAYQNEFVHLVEEAIHLRMITSVHPMMVASGILGYLNAVLEKGEAEQGKGEGHAWISQSIWRLMGGTD